MRISELIKYLQEQQKRFGDIPLVSEKDDGRSSWVSPTTLQIKYKQNWKTKTYQYHIEETGY